MLPRYVSVPHGDLGQGIDSLAPEDRIKEGFSEELVNWEPLPEGGLKTRTGYQRVLGNLPIRVESLTCAADGTMSLRVNGAIDLSKLQSRLKSRPVVLYGKTSSANPNSDGSFVSSERRAHYFSKLDADVRQVFAEGENTLVLSAEEHNLGTSLIQVGLVESLNIISLSNEAFLPDVVTANQATDELSIKYTNRRGAPFSGILFYKPLTASPGVTYVSSLTSVPTGTSTHTIGPSTHGLSNTNIFVKCFKDESGVYEEVRPEGVKVSDSGAVSVTLNNGTGSSLSVVFVLTRAPAENTSYGTVGAGTSVTVEIPSPGSPFNFVACYLEGVQEKEEILPNKVTYDQPTDTLSVTLENRSGTDASFFIHWEPVPILTNGLVLHTDPVTTAFTDPSPELFLWGITHEGIYSASSERGGWVNHLDNYRSEGVEFLIAGLGGNLFKGEEASPANRDTYKFGSAFASLAQRVSGPITCGPTFIPSYEQSDRTRGYIKGVGISNNFARADSFTYEETTGWTRLDLAIGEMEAVGTLGDIISTDPLLGDHLTVQGAGWKIHNGTYPIRQVEETPSGLSIWVDNPAVTSSDWDDSGSGASAGVFTDRVTWTNIAPFKGGDTLFSDLLPKESGVEVIYSHLRVSSIKNVTSPISFPNGLRVGAARTGAVIPLKTADGHETWQNFVAGDMVSLSGYKRHFRVRNVFAYESVGTYITGDGTTATVRLDGGSTDLLAVGDRVLLLQAGGYTGEVEVTDILTQTQFTFDSSVVGLNQYGILKGATLALDEEFEWNDSPLSPVEVAVTGRWIPLPTPTNEGETHPAPLPRAPYDSQPFVRSTMAADSLFLTNSLDRPLKYDGVSLYRPGLPRWNPAAFISIATSPASGGVISISQRSCSATGASSNKFKVALEDKLTFPVGTFIEESETHQRYRVIDRTDDGTDAYIVVERDVEGTLTSPTLSEVCTYTYYFRLNLVDTNGNIVASAATGAEDWTVELSSSAQVRIRLVGLPPLDIYDFDRVEAAIYRTTRNGVAPFYHLTTLPLSFKDGDWYLDYVDTDSDEDLRDLDAVMTALKGAELGTGWEPAPTAKCITSTENRLILANIKGNPEVDVRFFDKGSRITVDTLAGLSFLLRRDNTDGGEDTNLEDRVRLQFMKEDDKASISDITVEEGASFSVTSTEHGLEKGDWVYLFRYAAPSTDQSVNLMGWWQVEEAVSADVFKVLWKNAPASVSLSDEVDSWVAATDGKDIPVFLGTDHNHGMKYGNKSASGPYESLATRRLALALNTVMRVGVRRPWLVADAGGEFSSGQLIFRQPLSSDTIFEVKLPAFPSTLSLYANGVRRDPEEEVSARARLFGSRLVSSYPNFPEIFDNPFASVDSDSDSAVDVNPADGQDIVAVFPFYGTSSFGTASQESVVVAFKANSIYLVDFAAKARGQNPIQKIESQGLGCTAPYSVCPVKDGILFANSSGIYKLGNTMQVTYAGRRLQRLWREHVNKEALDLVNAGNWSFRSQVYVSAPLDGASYPSTAFTYDLTRAYTVDGYGEGSWTRFEGIPALGWANQEVRSFFASTNGRVYVRRDSGEDTDYRDDNRAVQSSATLRAMDFGDPSIRKAVSSATITYRIPEGSKERVGPTISYATNLSTYFNETDGALLPERQEVSGVADIPGKKGITLRYGFTSAKGNWFQLKVEHRTKDQGIELTQVSYRVAGLTYQGTKQAAIKPSE